MCIKIKEGKVMYYFEGESITDVFYKALEKIYYEGTKWQTKKGKVKELMPAIIRIKSSTKNILVIPERKGSIVATIAEFLWTVAGHEDVQFMKKYMPRCVNFSEDGKTWKGAYGPRIVNYHNIDQIKVVYDKLRINKYSREGIIELYDPLIDNDVRANAPGVPCTTFLHFVIDKKNRLNLYVTMRTNDLIWGFSGPNYFILSSLQEILAHWLNVEPGEYTQFVCSLNLFERHFFRAIKILDRKLEKDMYSSIELKSLEPDFQFEKRFEVLNAFFEIEKEFSDKNKTDLIIKELNKFPSIYIGNMAKILYCYELNLRGDEKHFKIVFDSLENDYLKLATIEYFSRVGNGSIKEMMLKTLLLYK